MPNEWAEDNRLTVCLRCGVREGSAQLYWVRNELICEGCGRDEIRGWNEAVLAPPYPPQPIDEES